MKGQWLGRLEGNDPNGEPGRGFAIVDLDDEGDSLRGTASYFDDDVRLSGTLARLHFAQSEDTAFEADIVPLDRRGGLVPPGQLATLFPDTIHGTKAKLHLKKTATGLHVAFETDIGTKGAGLLHQSNPSATSVLTPLPEVKTWREFTQFVTSFPVNRRFMFRGQPCTKKLRTSFHRTRRSDLDRFMQNDVPILHRHLTPVVKHLFKLNDPFELGAFFNLIQHHGYPTPLLDWSYSPFIAAFFAFRERQTEAEASVRILVFDRQEWCKLPQYSNVTYLPPHLSVIELLGVENERMIPQQALTTLTNLDDIEDYIAAIETSSAKQFLQAIDLPASERPQALSELSMMGITAASLFPGLDGSCEAMRGQMFGH